MYGQMTAGSWIYIASQGIVQGTFETFSAAGERHFGGSLEGKLLVTGGLGGMGGAQPLAATMAGALCLGIEVDPTRIEKRLQSGYCDKIARSLDEAMQLLDEARGQARGDFRRPGRQLRRCASGNGEARNCARHFDRSDERARRAQRLCA